MKTPEFEKKLLLSEAEYRMLQKLFFSKNEVTLTEQMNYYYDTPYEEFHRKGITCRIRQKGSRLKGTIKSHLSDSKDTSIEQSFTVETLPYRFIVNDRTVYLQGQLFTKRLETAPTQGILLTLDQNWYLGACDYELEIEYLPEFGAQTDGIYRTILQLLRHPEAPQKSPSKSQRFFAQRTRMPITPLPSLQTHNSYSNCR